MACCKTVLIILAIFGIFGIILGVVLGFSILSDVVIRSVEKNVRLQKGTIQFNRWQNPPIPLTFNVYFFEVTNPNEVLNGLKPIVAEVGPYVFRRTRTRQDVIYTETEDTLFYYQDSWFHFDWISSYPLQDNDTITTLNVPLMNAFQMIELNEPSSLNTVNNQWREAFEEMDFFHTFTVKEYLFEGVKFCRNVEEVNEVCSLIGATVENTQMLEQLDDGISFAFFRHKHFADDESYLIRAGNDNIEDVGKILEWREKSELEMWEEGETCRYVGGRDFTIYPPHITNDDVFDIFHSDICRGVTLEYVGEEEHSGIPGYRQELKNTTWTNTEDNSCFCTKITKNVNGEAECWPDGFLDLHSCTGAMIIISNPYFLDADIKATNIPENIYPKKDNHSTFVVFEPNTGTPLRISRKIQFNMVLRPIGSPTEDIEITRQLQGVVLPLMWVEEGMELPPNLIRELRDRYFDQLIIVDVVTWVLIGFGIFLFIGCGILVFVC